MNELEQLGGKNLVDDKQLRKAASAIHAAAFAETVAERIKDASMLEKALLEKLKGQRDFAAEYQRRFPERNQYTKSAGASSGAGNPSDWCLGFGFSQRTVQRWVSLIPEDSFRSKKNDLLKKCWQLAELWQSANYSSESVEWYTPARYLSAVREVLGEIDLDPASNEQANSIVKAKTIFTKADNGLSKEWFGRVFMNPPYGQIKDEDDKKKSLAGKFCDKALEEYESGRVSDCIILVNSLHSQSWQAPLYKHTVCFVDTRIQFVSGDGETNKNPTFQNIFVYLGNNIVQFNKVFSDFGYVMREVV